MNGSCSSMAFSPDGNYMFTVGDEAEVYQWDMRTRRCIAKAQDVGGFSTTSMSLSPNGQLLATGSKMGSVNLFHINNATTGVIEDTPFKTLMNLTTAVTSLSFNHSSELLAFSSKWKKNGVKIAHIPTYQAYKNFPGVAPGVLKYPFSLEFSHKSDFLALGNDEGKAHLFQLNHFS